MSYKSPSAVRREVIEQEEKTRKEIQDIFSQSFEEFIKEKEISTRKTILAQINKTIENEGFFGNNKLLCFACDIARKYNLKERTKMILEITKEFSLNGQEKEDEIQIFCTEEEVLERLRKIIWKEEKEKQIKEREEQEKKRIEEEKNQIEEKKKQIEEENIRRKNAKIRPIVDGLIGKKSVRDCAGTRSELWNFTEMNGENLSYNFALIESRFVAMKKSQFNQKKRSQKVTALEYLHSIEDNGHSTTSVDFQKNARMK